VFAVAFSFAAGTPVVCLFVVPLGPVALLSLVGGRLARQRRLFADQLPSHLQELAAAMRVGHSLVGALQTITDSAAEPTRAEFQRVLADERLGEPLDEALQPVARRMACDDVQQVALVASLHQRTGGNMAAVIDQVADGVRERGELRRELQALTAQARLSRWIVTLLPPTVLGIVALLDRPYIKPLFNTTTGVILLAVATGMVIAGSVVMKMIVKVEV
jgi:tight adherence protein B